VAGGSKQRLMRHLVSTAAVAGGFLQNSLRFGGQEESDEIICVLKVFSPHFEWNRSY
jgi:hypothetical protein